MMKLTKIEKKVVKALAKICRPADEREVVVAEEIGKIIFENLYRGDEDFFRSRSPKKGVSLKRISVGLRELDIHRSKSHLHSYVLVYLEAEEVKNADGYDTLNLAQRIALARLDGVDETLGWLERAIEDRLSGAALQAAIDGDEDDGDEDDEDEDDEDDEDEDDEDEDDDPPTVEERARNGLVRSVSRIMNLPESKDMIPTLDEVINQLNAYRRRCRKAGRHLKAV